MLSSSAVHREQFGLSRTCFIQTTAAVLLPSASAASGFWAVIPQILWHLYHISPELSLQASQEPYICQSTKQAVRGPKEKGMEQRWAFRGQDVIVCSSRAEKICTC